MSHKGIQPATQVGFYYVAVKENVLFGEINIYHWGFSKKKCLQKRMIVAFSIFWQQGGRRSSSGEQEEKKLHISSFSVRWPAPFTALLLAASCCEQYSQLMSLTEWWKMISYFLTALLKQQFALLLLEFCDTRNLCNYHFQYSSIWD